MMPLLDIASISLTFATQQGEVRAVKDVSLELFEGEVIGIVGESGSGKTQLVNSLLGLLPDNAYVEGYAGYAGNNLLASSQDDLNRIRSNEIAMVFQDPMSALNPYLKISTQLIEALVINQGMSKQLALQEAIAMLKKVQIPEAEKRIHDYPYQFSGGMRQRLMIAMALLRKPKILIADEPTTALDVTIQAEILQLLKTLRDEFSLSIILITHDMSIVAGQCDRIIVMYAGRVVESANIDRLFSEPKHPYTRGLLAAARSQSGLTDRLVSIPGNPPRNTEQIRGCAFYPRCEQKMDVCHQRIPELKGDAEQTQACFLYE